VIVSEVAGTTRDAVDSYFENGYGKYVFIDTAGIRRRSKVSIKSKNTASCARKGPYGGPTSAS
jgi:predicted GTPase